MASEGPINHVLHLAETIGCRPIGSPQNLEAAAYIHACFESLGLTVEEQDFPCPYWREESTLLDLEGEPLEACANTYSPSCDVEAETLPLCTLGELRGSSITRKVLIFYGALSQFELAAKGAIYISERDREIIHLLESGSPAAIITINPCLNCRWRLLEDYDLNIPSVTVSAAVGLKLLNSAGGRAHLKIVTHRRSSHSANVIARLAGSRPERIVLCAHYDSKIDTPGAYDNACGVAVLLELAHRFSQARQTYTLEFIAISGEEIYGAGDMEYARRVKDDFTDILTAINYDGVGPRLSTTTIAVFSASTEMDSLVNSLVSTHPSIQKVDPWPYSDHYLFYSHGVPSLALTSMGIRDIFHTPADTVDWISPTRLEEAIELGEAIVHTLDEHDFNWTRPSKI